LDNSHDKTASMPRIDGIFESGIVSVLDLTFRVKKDVLEDDL